MADGTLWAASELVNDSSADTPPIKAFKAYHAQRRTAKRRGIAWEFTLPEWWAWWQRDGNWQRRGREVGQVVMARFGDVGPYSAANVYCATHKQNIDDVPFAVRSAAAVAMWVHMPRTLRANHPLCQSGEAHPRSRPVLTPVGRFGTVREASEHYGIHHGSGTRKARERHAGCIYEDET